MTNHEPVTNKIGSLRLLVTTAAAIFLGGFLAAKLAPLLVLPSPAQQTIFQCVLLSILLMPALFFGLIQPMTAAVAALERTKEELHLAIAVADLGIWDWDTVKRKRTWSERCASLLGLAEGTEMSHAAFLNAIHPEDRQEAQEALDRALQENAPCDIEFRALWPDGTVRWIAMRSRTAQDEQGQPVRLTGTVQDITERKRIQEALKESASTLKSFFDSPGHMRGVIELEGSDIVHISANAPAAALFGQTPESMRNKPATELGTPPELIRLWSERCEESRRGNEPVRFEYVHNTAAGGRWLSGTICSLGRGATGRPRCAYMLGDITERKKAQDELCRYAEETHDLYNNSPCGYLSLDAQGTLMRVNDTALKWLGYAREDGVDRKKFSELLAPASQRDFHACFAQLKERGSIRDVELQMARRNGAPLPVLLNAAATTDAAGKFLMYRATVFDITERKRAEEALRLTQEQLLKAQKMEATGQLAADLAREFNNMLFVINSQAELALKNLPPDSQPRGAAEEILKTGNRLARLSRQVLAYSRRQILRARTTSLNDIVNDAHKTLQTLVPQQIAATTQLDPALKPVNVDPVQFGNALLELVFNARDAMPHGGKLHILTANVELDERFCGAHPGAKPGRYVMLAVNDTGCGMDDKVKAHLFQPFFTTKDAGTSAGLGLAAVYGIVKQSGGYIEVNSAAGKGTTVRIYLPQAEGEAKGQTIRARLASPGGTETVLIVDDDDVVRIVTCQMLRGLGYNVVEASSGPEVLAAFEQQQGHPQLVIVDVVMPEMSGPELVKRLHELRPGIKVIFTSGFTDPRLRVWGEVGPGMHFLQKPINLGVLGRKVREVLDEKS
ncbi:MAG: PAS domain S-box protein [Planctomycetota bacterium]